MKEKIALIMIEINDLIDEGKFYQACLKYSECVDILCKENEEYKDRVESLIEKIDATQCLYEDFKAENEILQDKFDKIDNWCKAYPVEVFSEPDFKKAHKVLKDAGMTLDAVSASNMRHVLKGIQKILEGK